MLKRIIDGKAISKTIRDSLVPRIMKLKENNIIPGLGIILVGDRIDSQTYVNMKKKICDNLGITNFDVKLPEDTTQSRIMAEVQRMNSNPQIHGILVQLPLPKHIDEETILNNVSLEKDIDGFHAQNIGNLALNRQGSTATKLYPCTPEGCIELLDRSNIEIEGKHAVIIGRSNIVGMPLALLLLHRNATVTICHSRTKNIEKITQQADILVTACGRTQMVKRDWIKEGVVIIDVGINNLPDETKKRGYRLVGDTDYDDVFEKVGAITPVPGGVGPMTICILMKHVVQLAEKQLECKHEQQAQSAKEYEDRINKYGLGEGLNYTI
jgi:5,10-methylene-tetrahydrofolate dehydrogenase/methenyl tetrahydrofolate cyclohydrolase